MPTNEQRRATAKRKLERQLERRAAQARADEAATTTTETPDATRVPRARKDRRRRIDPTTFEKQYTDAEMEFMTAMQNFKMQSGKSFPSHGDVLRVATGLGYRRLVLDEDPDHVETDPGDDGPSRDVIIMPCIPG